MIFMDDSELISKIRDAIDSDEDYVVRVIECMFLFDEYDRCKREDVCA